jgi:hypothetical protein
MATKTTKATKTLEPLYALTLVADRGKKAIVTDVCDRRTARSAAREYNRDFAGGRFRACVRPIAVRVLD